MFTAAKDAMTARAAVSFLNSRIGRYGKVSNLKLDSEHKTVELVCELEGEAQPVTVRIGRYVVEQEGGKTFLNPLDCSCSRPWLQHLLEDFVSGRHFEVPGWIRAAL